MPPKNQPKQQGGSKPKEDKTFGLKNKNKSSKVQKQVQTIAMQESQRGKNKDVLAKDKAREDKAREKEKEKQRKAEMDELMKPVVVQKVPFGVDPKSVVCQYYRAGTCEKGKKCKFSHDLTLDRKSEKKDIYTDDRDSRKNDTMDKWDDAKLSEVILSKHGNLKTTTDIVCKFFIDAIEAGTYGWFWECPNGGKDCKYRHSLPPGFKLKSQKKKEEEDEKNQQISLEEFLEVERHKLPTTLTPVTPESFGVWKKTRLDKKMAAEEAQRKAKEAQANAGKNVGLSGRDMFTFNTMLMDDEEDEGEDDPDWDFTKYRQQTEEERALAEEERLRVLRLEDGTAAEASSSTAGGDG